MQRYVREHVGGVTAVLTLVSLALVFGTALGAVPRTVLPAAPAGVVAVIPHVNAAISVVAVATIAAGVRAIRRGEIGRHRALMTTSFVLFVGFLILYLYKVAVAGPASFPGPDTVYRYVYLPVLSIHVLLAVVCLPLLYYVLLLALTHPFHRLGETAHRRVGRIAAPLWVVSFVLGLVVYVLLYWVY